MAKKLTNAEKQKELDFIKWNLSQIEHKDLSGQMEYCNYCQYQAEDKTCSKSQEEKELNSLCAKAMNKQNKKGV